MEDNSLSQGPDATFGGGQGVSGSNFKDHETTANTVNPHEESKDD